MITCVHVATRGAFLLLLAAMLAAVGCAGRFVPEWPAHAVEPVAGSVSPVHQDAADATAAVPRAAPDPDAWKFIVAPYSWLVAVSGDKTVRGTKARIDQSIGDVLSKVDFILQMHLEARKGPWSFALDPMIGFLSDEAEVGPLDVDVETDLQLVSLTAGYALYDGRLFGSDEAPRNLRLEAGVGAILVGIDTELDFPSPLRDPDFGETWVDLAVGCRALCDLSDHWRLASELLVGGFGIGEASERSILFEATLGRRLSDSITLWLGYRLLSLDYESGSGAKKFKADIAMQGPLVGVSFEF